MDLGDFERVSHLKCATLVGYEAGLVVAGVVVGRVMLLMSSLYVTTSLWSSDRLCSVCACKIVDPKHLLSLPLITCDLDQEEK